MIQVNNEWFYEDLTPESMKELMQQMKDGLETSPGPQIERNHAEGPEGRTTLHTMPDGIRDRDFEAAVEEWNAAKEAAKN